MFSFVLIFLEAVLVQWEEILLVGCIFSGFKWKTTGETGDCAKGWYLSILP